MKDLLHALDVAIRSPNLSIALDRDGTLVPYASRPELAVMHADLSDLLCNVSDQPGVDVAIISARSIAQLRGDFTKGKFILAGNYGLEVSFPDGRLCLHEDAVKAVPTLKSIRDTLAARIDLNSGTILEDHGYSLCLHFHAMPEAKRNKLTRIVDDMIEEFPNVRFRRLPTSYEVFPPFLWDKGMALGFIDSQLAHQGERPFYFYAGDSEADLPAFNWVKAHGGVSVCVGGSAARGAQFHLASTDHLQKVLEHILERRSQTSNSAQGFATQ